MGARMRSTLPALLLLSLTAASADAGVRNFFSPTHEGGRVDACLSGGVCGKPAADAFCKVQGYDRAVLFQRETVAETRALDSGNVCTGAFCTAFKQVKCFTTKSDLAALP